jgi:hypothetical protein
MMMWGPAAALAAAAVSAPGQAQTLEYPPESQRDSTR